MEPHLYLRRGKKRILLVRYFGEFHFVNLDHRLNYKVRSWFLAQPRTEDEMDAKGLVRTSIDVNDIRGVAAGGTGRGHVVQFYLKEGKRRYELEKDCALSDMGALFDGLSSFDPPKQDSNWSDPRLARQDPQLRKILWPLGCVMNIAACVSGFMVWAVGFELPWVCLVCLLTIILSLLLYCLFPDYYTVFREEREYGKKSGAMGLWAPVACSAAMLLGALSNYAWFHWWKAWFIGIPAVAVLGLVLYLAAPVFKAADKVAMFVIVGALLSGGPVLMMNGLLDSAPVQEIRTAVVDKEKHTSRKRADSYELTVILDGRERDIPVSAGLYSETEIGDPVTVEVHEGALGIPYAEIN